MTGASEPRQVVVIGAGPGGGATALHLARAGIEVLVVEEHGEVGVPVHCGECLSDLALAKLDTPVPDEVISTRVQGIRVIFPDGASRCLSEGGVVLEKHAFEQWLVEEAVTAGAEVRTGVRISAMDRVEGHWELSGRGLEAPLRAEVVVDASGVAAVAPRLLGWDEPVEVVAGLQFELSGLEHDGWLDFYLWPQFADDGYVWMIPKSGGRANVGLVTANRRGAVERLRAFIEATAFRGLTMTNPPWREASAAVRGFGGTIPVSGPRQRTITDGLVLVGDAAGFTSPLFEGGSHLALSSGRMAATAIAAALAAGDTSAAALASYESAWKATFPPYDRILKGKRALYDFNDHDLAAVGSALPAEMATMGPASKVAVGLRLLGSRPDLLARGAVPALQAFGLSRAKHHGW